MIETGLVVCLGLVIWWTNISWSARMWMLSHSLFMDLAVFVFLTVLHWGTFSGVMSATAGALMTSVLLKFGRFVYGYREDGKYIPGYINVAHQL